MSKKHWFLHILGETMGPLSTEVVKSMLQQNRLQFADFLWCEELTKWTRVSDVHDFAALLPPYPDAPIPKKSGSGTGKGREPVPEPEPEPEPVSAPAKSKAHQAPAAKAAPAPAPAPASERNWPSVRRY